MKTLNRRNRRRVIHRRIRKKVRGSAERPRLAVSFSNKNVYAQVKAANIRSVVFDRGGFIYHGKMKALADAAREGGLEF